MSMFWNKKPEPPPEKIKATDHTHAGGFTVPHHSQLYPDSIYTEEQIMSHKPLLQLSPIDPHSKQVITGQAGVALQASMQKADWKYPRMYMNPMQELDYMVIEALMKTTFGGPLMNALTKFIVGTGFRPELEIIKPDKDADKNKQTIEKYAYVIEALQAVDRRFDDNETTYLENSLIDSMTQLIGATNMFNRSALLFEYDQPLEINGVKYKEIPSSLTYVHPAEMGMIETTPSGQLERVECNGQMVETTDMIYLWNPLISATYRNAKWYGGSMVLPMQDALRTLRRIIAVDFPLMAETSATGSYIMAVKPQGQTADTKRQEYQQVANNHRKGAINFLMEDPEDIDVHDIQFDPKIKEFQEMCEFLIKYCIASQSLPNSMFFDEASSNRSTLLGKIQLATSTVIEPTRQILARQINQQWYMRWFKLMFKDDPAWEEVRPKLTFNDLHIDQWFDKVSAVNEIDARHQLLDKAYGELSGIPDYENRIDPNEETVAGGSSNNSGAEFEKRLGDAGSGDPMKRRGSQGAGDSEKRRAS